MKVIPVLFALAMAQGPSSNAVVGPRVPYYDWNACPFECCTYRKWKASKDVPILKERRRDAAVAYRLVAGEAVQAITGVGVTTRVGHARVFKATHLGEAKIPVGPGDVISVVRYAGEGYWKFWFKGRFDVEQIPDIDDSARDTELDLRMLSHPEVTWWVKIRNRYGKLGWTTETDGFEGADACGP